MFCARLGWAGHQVDPGGPVRAAADPVITRAVTRWVMPVVGAGVALALIFLMYRDLDFGRFVSEVAKAKPSWIILLGATILLEHCVQGWKWRQLLFELKPISSLHLTGAFLAGYAANFLVPLGISPLVRSWLVARMNGLKMVTVLVTTVISRFIDGIVFAILACLVAVAGQIPSVEGNLRIGLMVAGGLNLVLFGGILWLLYRSRASLTRDDSLLGRLIDRLAALWHARLDGLRAGTAEGIIWPMERKRQAAVIAASFAMKGIASIHFLFAGLAVGVTLGVFDYLFLMVFAGFALVLARFIRVPGGFVIGSAFALNVLGVPDEPAVAMILFTHISSTLLVGGIGLVVLWQSGLHIRRLSSGDEETGPAPLPAADKLPIDER